MKSNAMFRMKLAPYQLVGLNWLILMHSQNINGILGDEMVSLIPVLMFFIAFVLLQISTFKYLLV